MRPGLAFAAGLGLGIVSAAVAVVAYAGELAWRLARSEGL